jgi:hypothetical protein
MNAELSTLKEWARRHAALGEPARLAIVQRLLLSDAARRLRRHRARTARAPRTVTAARRHGLRLQGTGTRRLDAVLRPGDLVVAVCDNAHEHAARTGD